MDQYVQWTTTTETESQSLTIADHLVANGLAACVQIDGPIQSVYRWRGKVEHVNEFRLSIKTTLGLAEQMQMAILDIHPYDVPELIGVPVTHISKSYAAWIDEQIRDSPK